MEHYNLIVSEAMVTTLKDKKYEPKIALAWAVSVKNALQNNFGHSPNKLVFGFNINTPSVLTDQLPALEAAITRGMGRVNSNALHAVSKSFMDAESSKKFQRTLRANVRTYADEGFVTDDSFYYREPNCKRWYNPAKVLGEEGQRVLIRHGNAFHRMHLCHLMKVNKEFQSPRN